MSALAALQSEFLAALRAGDSARLAALSSDGGRGGAIYAHGYRARLAEVLALDYPALGVLLGAAAVDALFDAYIAATPSRHRSLRWYGVGLADFLAARDDAAPWQAEVARFEWALGEAFDALDAEPMVLGELLALAPDDLLHARLRVAPALRRIDLCWNAPDLVAAARAGGTPPPPTPQSRAWLVWRQAQRVRYKALALDEACALDAVMAGADFAAMCGALAAIDPARAAERAAGLLRTWCALEVLRDLR